MLIFWRINLTLCSHSEKPSQKLCRHVSVIEKQSGTTMLPIPIYATRIFSIIVITVSWSTLDKRVERISGRSVHITSILYLPKKGSQTLSSVIVTFIRHLTHSLSLSFWRVLHSPPHNQLVILSSVIIYQIFDSRIHFSPSQCLFVNTSFSFEFTISAWMILGFLLCIQKQTRGIRNFCRKF